MSEIAYDLIGDVHGQAGLLERLLEQLGYVAAGRGFKAPAGRQAVFVGDLIDRGPQQLRVLEIVRAMMDAGDARVIMGNHELNAIGYVERKADGSGFLREHSPEKVAQHAEFLRQVGEGSAAHKEWVDWFRILPLALDLGGVRVVHAWWHQPYVDAIERAHPGGSPIAQDFLHAAFRKGSSEWQAVEGLCKGLEVRLPEGCAFEDHGGHRRHEVRVKWWADRGLSLRDAALLPASQRQFVPEIPLPADLPGGEPEGAPVFVGHYWMKGAPVLQSAKLACLDWSAAKGGPLVAYRWDGEAELVSSHLCWADH